MTVYCENQQCENPGTKHVPVSVHKPSDQQRTVCACCQEAYTWGVQHGRMTGVITKLWMAASVYKGVIEYVHAYPSETEAKQGIIDNLRSDHGYKGSQRYTNVRQWLTDRQGEFDVGIYQQTFPDSPDLQQDGADHDVKARFVVQHDFDHEPTYVIDTDTDDIVAELDPKLPSPIRRTMANMIARNLSIRDALKHETGMEASPYQFMAGGFVVLTHNPDNDPATGQYEAWAYHGPLNFDKASPIKFGLGTNPISALNALADLMLA